MGRNVGYGSLDLPRVLVTGCAGFIGRRLANRLVDLGYRVSGVDTMNTEGWMHPKCGTWPINVRWGLTGDYNVVYHLATHNITKCAANPEFAEENIQAAWRVAKTSRERGARLIYASSASVYGDQYYPAETSTPLRPSSAYALTKLAGEKFALDAGGVVLRFSNVYGPGQRPENPACGVVARYIDNALKGKSLYVFNKDHVRDYTYIEDVLDMLVWAKDMPTGVYNVSTGVGTTTLELAEAIVDRVPSRPNIVVKPDMARSFDTLSTRIVVPDERLAGRTIPLWQGLDMTFDWFRNGCPEE